MGVRSFPSQEYVCEAWHLPEQKLVNNAGVQKVARKLPKRCECQKGDIRGAPNQQMAPFSATWGGVRTRTSIPTVRSSALTKDRQSENCHSAKIHFRKFWIMSRHAKHMPAVGNVQYSQATEHTTQGKNGD